MGLDLSSKLGQSGPAGLPLEEQPAQLCFKRFDRSRQGRLRYATAPCGPGEIAFLGQRQEVSHLCHFHDGLGSNGHLLPVHSLRPRPSPHYSYRVSDFLDRKALHIDPQLQFINRYSFYWLCERYCLTRKASRFQPDCHDRHCKYDQNANARYLAHVGFRSFVKAWRQSAKGRWALLHLNG